MDAFHAYRNEPEVAQYQDWPTPFLKERAAVVIGEAATLTDLGTGEWMMLTIANAEDSEVYGDLFVEFSNDGRTGEIGYSLAPKAWGNGYAAEAVEALLEWLFAREGFTRACGSLHPDNSRSARVLERCGFVYEGHTRNSYWLGDENSDDWLYGLTPQQYSEWRDRPRHTPESVELREVDPTKVRSLLALGTHHSQQRFVSPMAVSFAEVAFPDFEEHADGRAAETRIKPWARVVYADGEPVGFVAMEQPTELNPEPYLWRLLIDRLHQRRGLGTRVIEMVADQAREWGGAGLLVSWMPGVGSPEPVYLAMGFVPTGEMYDQEIVAQLVL